MTLRDAALEHSARYFDRGQFQTDLARLVALPSESQNPHAPEHLQNYLDHCIIPMLGQMGFTCRVLTNPKRGAGPFLLAERIEAADGPTILTYGHGDVVRGAGGSMAGRAVTVRTGEGR